MSTVAIWHIYIYLYIYLSIYLYIYIYTHTQQGLTPRSNYFTGVILKYDLKIAAFCRWSSRGFPKNDFSPLNSWKQWRMRSSKRRGRYFQNRETISVRHYDFCSEALPVLWKKWYLLSTTCFRKAMKMTLPLISGDLL